jgi:hypothetical protein
VGLPLESTVEYAIPDLGQYLWVDVSFDDAVGIDDYESGSYIGKDLILGVSSD